MHGLQVVYERLRLDSESRLEESMAAFNNAETDKVKRLKQELEREKNKGKTLEERNEALLKVRWKISAVNNKLPEWYSDHMPRKDLGKSHCFYLIGIIS